MTAKELLFERFPEAAEVPAELRTGDAPDIAYWNELRLREVLQFAGEEWARVKTEALEAREQAQK